MEDLYTEKEDEIRDLIETMDHTNQEIADQADVDLDTVKAVCRDYDADDADADTPDEEEKLAEEMGPVSIGKIAVEGTFSEYECKCGKTFDAEQDALNHSNDTGHTHGWKAYEEHAKTSDKAMATVSGPSTMR